MSFMTAEEYYNYLLQIQSSNPPTVALLSNADKPYKIDISTRQVEAPEFLSVEKDHKSETLYFLVDRYVDYIDLADTTCLVQYTNLTTGKSFIYHVPFYDIVTYSGEFNEKILFPWCIDGAATEAAGTVRYAFQFYKVDPGAKGFLYCLNTVPAESKVLHGMSIEGGPGASVTPTDYEYLLGLYDKLDKEQDSYWDEV